MKIRYLLLVLTILTLSIYAASPSSAQSASGISGFHNVTLWVYPEYDDPRLLVMLEGKVNASEVPSRVNFLVPQGAEMYSAGSKDTQGTYSGGPPDRTSSQISGWDEISYQLKTDTFRVEYYDDIITGSPNKTVSYDFRWLYPITGLTVIIQQPLKASNFTVTPAGAKSTENEFTVYTYSYLNPDITQPLHFDLSYTKTDPNPSVGSSALNPPLSSSPGTADNTGSAAGSLTLIVIGALLLVVLGVFLSVNLLRKKKPLKVVESRRRISPTAPSPGDKFCDQCGRPVGRRFKFCPHCGNNLGT